MSAAGTFATESPSDDANGPHFRSRTLPFDLIENIEYASARTTDPVPRDSGPGPDELDGKAVLYDSTLYGYGVYILLGS
jgi:hypothetical protein